jgi:hypothetical protein
MRLRLLLAFLLGGLVTQLPAGEWTLTQWNGEDAYASSSGDWRAVVSVARGRLMHFGPAGSELNLLLAPAGPQNRNRRGGHRLWLGPQAEWTHGWPPPDAWEYRAPESVTTEAGVLRLAMFPTGDAWPRLTRTYRWAGASLVCGAEFSGGTRPAQFVHILQVRPGMVVTADARPENSFPAGYVLLPSTAGPFAAHFAAPSHVSRTGDTLALHHTGVVTKLGFRPQTLTGRIDGHELQVSRGTATGETVGAPDEGFFTQVYFSEANEAFAELEQLSPLFAPGRPARFEIVLTGRAF